jgi:hypothetical protein
LRGQSEAGFGQEKPERIENFHDSGGRRSKTRRPKIIRRRDLLSSWLRLMYFIKKKNDPISDRDCDEADSCDKRQE